MAINDVIFDGQKNLNLNLKKFRILIFKNKIESMDREIEEVNQKYNLMESQLKNETQERLELEKMLEQEIKQKQQLEVSSETQQK